MPVRYARKTSTKTIFAILSLKVSHEMKTMAAGPLSLQRRVTIKRTLPIQEQPPSHTNWLPLRISGPEISRSPKAPFEVTLELRLKAM